MNRLSAPQRAHKLLLKYHKETDVYISGLAECDPTTVGKERKRMVDKGLIPKREKKPKVTHNKAMEKEMQKDWRLWWFWLCSR